MSINIITGTISQQDIVDDIDLQETFNVINAPEQSIIEDNTLISKQYADDHYTSGSGNATFIQYPSTGIANTKLQCGNGILTASFSQPLGVIDFQNNPNPISILINEPVSSSNPTTLSYVQTNYINKQSDIGLQSQNIPVTTNIDANSHLVTNILDPISDQDASSKFYTDQQDDAILGNANGYTQTEIASLSSIYMPVGQTLSQISTTNLNMGQIDFNNQTGINVSLPINNTDIATKQYVDNSILPTSNSLQEIYDNQPSDLNIASNKFQSTFVATSSNDITNLQKVIDLDAIVQQYTDDTFQLKTATLQDIFDQNASNLNIGSQQLQSSYLASVNNDIPNLGQVNALDLAAISTAVQDSNDFTVQQLADKNFIEFTNLSVTQSRVQCNLNNITIAPNANSLSQDTLVVDCQNRPNITPGTSVIRFSSNQSDPLLFLNLPTVSRYPVFNEEICTKLYADTKLDGTFSLQDIYTLNPSNLDVSTNEIYSSAIPSFDNQLTNKLYVDQQISAIPSNYYENTVPLNNITLANGTLNMNSQKISGLQDGTLLQDAVSKSQLDQNLIDGNSYTNTQIDGLSLQTIFNQNPTDLSIGNQVIYSIHVPNNVDELCNKAYVDSVSGGGGLPSNSTLNSIASNNLTNASVDLNNQKIINLAPAILSSDSSQWGQTYNVIQGSLTGSQSDTLYIAPNSLSLSQQGVNNLQIQRIGGNEVVFNILDQRTRFKTPALFTVFGNTNSNQLVFSDSAQTLTFGNPTTTLSLNNSSGNCILGQSNSGHILIQPTSTIFSPNNQPSMAIYDDGINSGIVRVNLNGNAQPISYLGVDGQNLLTQQLQIGSSTDTASNRMKFYYNGLTDSVSNCPIDVNKYIGYHFNTATEILNNNDYCLISKGVFKNYSNLLNPIGSIITSAIQYGNASSMLPCYLPCNGSSINSGLYPQLFSLIGGFTPNFTNKYQRSGQAGDTMFSSITGQNLSHTHGLSTGILTMNSHSHGSGSLQTIANNTSVNTLFTATSNKQGGYIGGATVNNCGVDTATNIVSKPATNMTFTDHTHSIPQLSLTGNTASVVSTGSISGNSSSNGGSKIEVDSLIVFYYIRCDFGF